MAMTFQGMDPNTKRSAADAWADFKGFTGLSDEYLDQAKAASGWTGGDFTGAQWNTLGQAWANQTGNQFAPWQQPAAGPAASSSPLTFQGVDPTSRRGADQAWADFKGFTGLGDEYLNEAKQVSGWTGGDVTGDQWNALGQAWASRTGNQFNPWQAPAAGGNGPPPPPDPAPLTVPDTPPLTLGRLADPTPFVAPDANAVYADPGYQARQRDAQKAMESAAAARGILRTGGTLHNIGEQASRIAQDAYGDAYDRAFLTWEGNLGANERTLAANNQATLAEYDPDFAMWQARLLADDRNADRSWQQYIYGNDDWFRRNRADRSDADFDRTFNASERWRQTDFDEDRRRFLAELGLRAS